MTTLNVIGSSPKFRALMAEVAWGAPVDSAVLIQGETGTGKQASEISGLCLGEERLQEIANIEFFALSAFGNLRCGPPQLNSKWDDKRVWRVASPRNRPNQSRR